MSVQLDLKGKKSKDMKICSECGKYVPVLYSGAIYHPFDNSPSYEYLELCEICEMKILRQTEYCELCERQIFHNNGLRKNIRAFPEFPESYKEYEPTICCVKCCQEIWFDHGMKYFKNADWFSEAELQNSEYTKYETFFCDYDKAEILFNELKENGNVIVSLESSGMGIEHTYSLWIKPNFVE